MSETYPQYLKRVGSDYRESDSESATADDYFESADRLLTIANYLNRVIEALDTGRKLDAFARRDAVAKLREALREVNAEVRS